MSYQAVDPLTFHSDFSRGALLTIAGEGESRKRTSIPVYEDADILPLLMDGLEEPEDATSGWQLKMIACWTAQPPSQGLLPLPMSKHVYNDLVTLLSIPHGHAQILESGLPAVLESTSSSSTPPSGIPSPDRTFVIQLNATGMCGFSAVISIWSKWRSIRAICFGSHEEEGSLWMSELEKSTLPLHWTVLPVVAMQAFCGFWTDKLKNVHGRVSDAEHSTGMRRWLDPNVPVPEQVDLTQITRVLNSDIASAANHVSQSTTSIIVLGRLRQQLSNDTKDIQSSALRAIDMHIDYLVTAYEGERERAVYLKERASAQMQTVFSMVAQRDSKTNLEIAEASKKLTELSREDNLRMMQIAEDSRHVALATARDSAAMRIIAAMTMVFLPATTVATLFSSSFFDFQPKDGDHVSIWIWLYIVATVILTAVVLSSWGLTSRLKLKSIELGKIHET